MVEPRANLKIAVLGLGNVLMGDDGAGVAALDMLRGRVDEEVVLAEVGTAALKAQALLEEVDCVVAIDAVQAAGRPGSVYCFSMHDVEIDACHSLHEMGVAGVLKLMPEESRPEVWVVGVEPESIELKMELSPAVRAALPKVAEAVLATIDRLRSGARPADAGPAHSPDVGIPNVACRDPGEQNRLGRGQNWEHLFAGGGILASGAPNGFARPCQYHVRSEPGGQCVCPWADGSAYDAKETLQ